MVASSTALASALRTREEYVECLLYCFGVTSTRTAAALLPSTLQIGPAPALAPVNISKHFLLGQLVGQGHVLSPIDQPGPPQERQA